MPTPARLDADDLRALLAGAEPPRVLDVRTPAEFESEHIPGAHNVPLDLLRRHADELSARLGPGAVLVCRSGARADQALEVLPGARVLAGGMAGWRAAGGAVRAGRRVWDVERQVRFTAGLLVVLGLLGSLVVPALVGLSAFVGGALVLTSALGICPMATALARMPWNRGTAPPDLRRLVAALARQPMSGGATPQRSKAGIPRWDD